MTVFVWYKANNRFSREIGGICTSHEQALENLNNYLKLREQEFHIDIDFATKNNIEEFVLDE